MISTKTTLFFICLAITLCQCTNRNNKQEDNEPSCENTEYLSFIKDRALADSIYTFFRSAECYEESDLLKRGSIDFGIQNGIQHISLMMVPAVVPPLVCPFVIGSFPLEDKQIIIFSSEETIPFMETSGFNVDEAYVLLGKDSIRELAYEALGVCQNYEKKNNKWVPGRRTEVRVHRKQETIGK